LGGADEENKFLAAKLKEVEPNADSDSAVKTKFYQ
jgi:hypothetical protein